jgi:peroxin-19
MAKASVQDDDEEPPTTSTTTNGQQDSSSSQQQQQQQQQRPTTEEEKLLQDLFANLANGQLPEDLLGEDDDANIELPPNFNPDEFMDGMMEQLLSKELMYEPMKEVCLKFPNWLSENKDKLSDEEYQRRTEQYRCFQQLVDAYEDESSEDNAVHKTSKVMDLMQQIQEYGQPPIEIVNEIAPGLELDDNGIPKMDNMMNGVPLPFLSPGGDEECRIM